jgi:transport inhibitor response 1
MGGRAAPPPLWHALPDEVWEHAFSFLPAASDRGAAAGACRAWLRAERCSRRRLSVTNCYAASPADAVDRFPAVRAAAVKGKPHFADFGLVPPAWGAAAAPWVAAAARGWPLLEELSFKRMVVTDECLEMVAASFSNFRALRLVSCEGFSTAGLAAIAAGCRSAAAPCSTFFDLKMGAWLDSCSTMREDLSFFPGVSYRNLG